MKDLLWISASVPYDIVAHAGGKIQNYYLKYLKKQSNYHIKLISFYWEREKEKIDLHKYGIESILLKRSIFGFPRTILNLESFLNPYNRYANINQNYTIYQLKFALRQIKESGFRPYVIILQWTEMLVLIDQVKQFFPNAKIIGIEEDVKFLNFQRDYQNEKNPVSRYFKRVRYSILKRIELQACNKVDKVILNNEKDYRLLAENNIIHSKLFVWQPYFENRTECEYEGKSKNIIFYGAMGRKENYESAIWFIKNVFFQLQDESIQFWIIGGGPSSVLQKYASDRIKITGYVEDIGPYFQNGLCLVAPLLLGAGIKIKVLEAMSAGIPVLTNEIGIEGIPAENKKDFFLCKSPKDYLDAIKILIDDLVKRQSMSSNAKQFIKRNFNLQLSADNFMKLLMQLEKEEI